MKSVLARVLSGLFACQLLFLPLAAGQAVSDAKQSTEPLQIASQRELFVDGGLVDQLVGRAELRLHHPQPKEIAIVHDAPWEGSGSGYLSVFQDGPLYRMYYKAWQLDVSPEKVATNAHPLYCCYAESEDGIHWRKPEVGVVEFQGSKQNNIVMVGQKYDNFTSDPGHPAVFKDENPAAPADARYKAIIRAAKPRGLLLFKSADGLHWSPMCEAPVITEGAFDSQNLAFWDPMHKQYRAYWRIFTAGVTDEKNWKPQGVRAIRTAMSADLLHWGPHADVTYVDSPAEHLYVNQVKPYYRAPQILIGFPTRYIERGWCESMKALPELEHRQWRSKASQRYGTAITEGLLMASRDGVRFKRWNEAFLRPGIEREGTWNYGHQYLAWHVVETRSDIEGAPHELSLYATESYWTGNSSAVRRYTLRLDGFVSASAPMSGGELITRPVVFQGKRLELNVATSAAGSVRVELQDAAGKPLAGFALEDCDELFGDSLQRAVSWKGSQDVSGLAGKPVRVRFAIKDADVYALQFVP